VSRGFFRGRRRVLIIGLPLLHVLSERGFRGVLAHEFGHYAGGDTRLGPWIWRTRDTIGRTIGRLTDAQDDSWGKAVVRAPFTWYGKAFLRITNAISRREEFAADATAVREVGRDAHVEGLRRIHALAPGFDMYWANDVVPVLSSGHRPPILAGFASFVNTNEIRKAAAAHLERELAEEKAHAYDSHPTLAERIAAVREAPAGPPDDSPPAHTLLDDEARLERRALAELASDRAAADRLDPMRWEDAAEGVWIAGYRKLVEAHRDLLEGLTVAALWKPAINPRHIAMELQQRERPLSRDESITLAHHLLTAAFTLVLVRAGWRAQALPGEPVSVSSGGERIVPAEIVASLAAGEVTEETWRERAGALDVAGASLADAGSEAAPA